VIETRFSTQHEIPLAGNEKGDRPGQLMLLAADPALRAPVQGLLNLLVIVCNKEAALGKGPPPHLQGRGDVSQILPGIVRHRLRKTGRHLLQVRGFFGREHKQLRQRWRDRPGWEGLRLFKEEMSIRSPNTKSTDPRASGPACIRGGPGTQRGIHIERAGFYVTCRIGLRKMEAGRYLTVLQGQGRLDELGHTCCGIKVPDIRLERAQRAEANAGTPCRTERLR
jgi:hypothetical protein